MAHGKSLEMRAIQPRKPRLRIRTSEDRAKWDRKHKPRITRKGNRLTHRSITKGASPARMGMDRKGPGDTQRDPWTWKATQVPAPYRAGRAHAANKRARAARKANR